MSNACFTFAKLVSCGTTSCVRKLNNRMKAKIMVKECEYTSLCFNKLAEAGVSVGQEVRSPLAICMQK